MRPSRASHTYVPETETDVNGNETSKGMHLSSGLGGALRLSGLLQSLLLRLTRPLQRVEPRLCRGFAGGTCFGIELVRESVEFEVSLAARARN
jgi:hypothetical protein